MLIEGEFILSLGGVCAVDRAFSITPLASTSLSVAFCALVYRVVNTNTFSDNVRLDEELRT